MTTRRWLYLLLALLLIDLILFQWWRWEHREHRYDKLILEAAARYHVDAALVKAIIWKESRFDKDARGKAGEIGLMQLREAAAREWASAEAIKNFEQSQLFDARQNTLAGTWYIRKLLARYRDTDHPVTYALADYNAGRRNVLRWTPGAAAKNHVDFLKQMDFPTTKEYVRAVLEHYKRYQKQFSGKTAAGPLA